MSSPGHRFSIDSTQSSISAISSNPQFSSITALDNIKHSFGPGRSHLDSRKSSIASTATGIGGTLDSSHHRGSVAEAGQNAIFTLLQPQIVRTGLLPQAQTLPNWKAPTSRDIPPVVLSNIPQADQSAIQTYLSLIGSSYDILRRVKAVVEQSESSATTTTTNQPQSPSQQSSLKPTVSDLRLDSYQSRRPSAQSNTSDNERRPSSSRPKGPSTAPLSTVPSIYFDNNFHLENPRTFDFVTERSDIIRSPQHVDDKGKPKGDGAFPPRKALATNAILQEKLSWYLDTVEIHLITSISNASTTFFTALGSLQALHAEATASVEKIQALQNDLSNLDSDMALGGLQVVQLQRRRENVRRLTEATTQLQEVITSVSSCEKLINGGEYMTGLDELEDVIKLLFGEPPKRERKAFQKLSSANMRLVDLRRLHVLDGASNDLDELRNRIRTGLERKFSGALLQDLRKHAESVPTATTLSRLGSLLLSSKRISRAVLAQEPAYMVVGDELRTKLRSQISGLHRVSYATAAATTYKAETFRELKTIVRRYLPSANDDDTLSTASGQGQNARPLNQQERSSILARNLRQLDPEDAYTMFLRIYANTSEFLRRLSTQIKILLDIISDLDDKQEESSRSSSLTRKNGRDGSKSRSVSPMQHSRNRILDILDMSNLLTQAIELVQGQIVKVLRVRSDQTVKLPLTEFIRYFSLNKLFVTECEAISGSGSAALNSLINGQIKDFVANFGDNQLRWLIQVMDSDRWDAKDFGDEEKQRLSNILETETSDPEVWTSTSKIWEESKPTEVLESQTTSPDNASASQTKEKARTAVIGDQKYILPESAVAVLNILEDFLHLVAEMPSMIPDIAPRLLDCLKLFNSRSSQLILGAGATRSAGLKNITTKHLSLASQALSFIIALIPYMREFIRRHSTTSSHVAEFDKVKRLYQDHQNGIHEKLVEIMSSRATVHVAAMKKIDWDVVDDTKATSPYMEILTKETGTLYRVLSKHLPSFTVAAIMEPVFENYKRQWSDAFQSATISTERGRQRMLSDLDLFKSRIDKIQGSGDLSEYLITLVKAKTVIPTPKVSTSEGTSESAGST